MRKSLLYGKGGYFNEMSNIMAWNSIQTLIPEWKRRIQSEDHTMENEDIVWKYCRLYDGNSDHLILGTFLFISLNRLGYEG